MLNKMDYFCNQKDGEYFDSQEEMAYDMGMDVQPIRRSVKKLFDVGILRGRKVRWKGKIKWVYTDISPPEKIKGISKEREEEQEIMSYENRVIERKALQEQLDHIEPPF